MEYTKKVVKNEINNLGYVSRVLKQQVAFYGNGHRRLHEVQLCLGYLNSLIYPEQCSGTVSHSTTRFIDCDNKYLRKYIRKVTKWIAQKNYFGDKFEELIWDKAYPSTAQINLNLPIPTVWPSGDLFEATEGSVRYEYSVAKGYFTRELSALVNTLAARGKNPVTCKAIYWHCIKNIAQDTLAPHKN